MYDRPFRWWVQSVMPLVFDDSLSYYEVLAKLTKYIEGLTGDVSQIEKILSTIEGIEDVAQFTEFLENIQTEIGDLANLSTQSKTNLVSAINEIALKADIAYYKPPTGIPESDLSQGVQDKLNKTAEATKYIINNKELKAAPSNNSPADLGLGTYSVPEGGIPWDTLSQDVRDKIESGSGGEGGTKDYNELSNKPQINGHTLNAGNNTTENLGIGTYNKPSTGIPENDLSAEVQNKLNTSGGIADSETSFVATRDYEAGELIYINGVLYKTKYKILNGTNLIPGNNIETTDISNEIEKINSDIKALQSGSGPDSWTLATNVSCNDKNTPTRFFEYFNAIGEENYLFIVTPTETNSRPYDIKILKRNGTVVKTETVETPESYSQHRFTFTPNDTGEYYCTMAPHYTEEVHDLRVEIEYTQSQGISELWTQVNNATQLEPRVGALETLVEDQQRELDALDDIPDRVETLENDLENLKSDVDDINNALFDVSRNVYDPDTEWVNGTFSNGVLVELTTGLDNAAEEDYIPVTPNDDWVISWKAVDLNCTLYVETYREDKTWINRLGGSSMNRVTRSCQIATPNECAFIRLRIYRSGAAWDTIIPDEIQVEKGTTPTEYEPKSKTSKFVAVNEEIDNLQEQIDENPALTQRREVATNTNLLFPSVKGYLKNDGTFNTTTNGWQRSDYIPVEPDTFMYFHGINQFSYYGFFNANKEWIGGRDIETPVVSDGSYLISHQVPDGASFMIVSFEDAYADTAWGNYLPVIPNGDIIYANTETLRAYSEYPENPCDYNGLDICTFRKGLCIGDSLTAGGFNYKSGTNPWSDGNVYSYPSQLEKMTGIPITNKGDSGVTSVEWWETYGTGGTDPMDFSGYDFAIIHLGVNDVSYNVSSEDTQTAIQNIINALKSANTGIKIFVCTIIPAYAINGINTYDTINTLIKSFAVQENVYCCDLTTYSHTYKNSQYAAGHLTAYGYWMMAKDIMAYIGYIMRKYPAEFRFIQFIGTDMTY